MGVSMMCTKVRVTNWAMKGDDKGAFSGIIDG